MHPRHIYVHVPFCARRCSYCDFAISVRRVVPTDAYVDALVREVEIRYPDGDQWVADTLYLGGGTPSLLGAEGIALLLDRLRGRVTLSPDAEVTLEANPDDVEVEAVRAWREAGVNRLSVGAQSFDDRALAWMHRTHTASRIGTAIDAAHSGGIDNVSLDLIFALPEKLGRDWEADVLRALSLHPTHISLYGLTIEPATPLGRWRERGEVTEAPEERYEADFLRAHELLALAGFEHYEVSNYARAGLRSRHNSSYWSHVPYAGIGPAAHSFDGASRRWNVPAYAAWARELAGGCDPIAGSEVLTRENLASEQVYLGLRTIEGLLLEPEMDRQVHAWVTAGWAFVDVERVRLTPAGWLRLDALAASLTTAGSPS